MKKKHIKIKVTPKDRAVKAGLKFLINTAVRGLRGVGMKVDVNGDRDGKF